MKLQGGYNVLLRGRPGSEIEPLPEPELLRIPLSNGRLTFSELLVSEGQRVRAGQDLAKDPTNHSLPLLAPRSGTVRLEAVEGHIVLEDLGAEPAEEYDPAGEAEHAPKGMGSAGMLRYRLLRLGAWQFIRDAHTGAVPHPFEVPRAVVVSTLRTEPFTARGDVQLKEHLKEFTRGLEHLQSLLEYQPFYLVVPKVQSALAGEIQDVVRGHAFLHVVPVPLRYPFGHTGLVARRLGLMRQADSCVWGVTVEGVLAVDRALTHSRPCCERVISLAGPSVQAPTHFRAPVGYPLEALLSGRVAEGPVRAVNGGVLTGRMFPEGPTGLDGDCVGVTVLPEQTEREFLSFVRPGWDRGSYSRSFLSVFRGRVAESLTTGVRGERRACVSCGQCEEVCPARIMPQMLHRVLYAGDLDEAERYRVDLCIGCGLCSYVCPSKIELRQQFLDAQAALAAEHAEAEEAAV